MNHWKSFKITAQLGSGTAFVGAIADGRSPFALTMLCCFAGAVLFSCAVENLLERQ